MTNNEYSIGDARSVMIIFANNGHGDRVQMLDGAICVSRSANTFSKGINQTVFPPDMGK